MGYLCSPKQLEPLTKRERPLCISLSLTYFYIFILAYAANFLFDDYNYFFGAAFIGSCRYDYTFYSSARKVKRLSLYKALI